MANKGDWKIDRVESYWYMCGRNNKEYVEITFWYNPFSLERKETSRNETCYCGQEYSLPDWAKVITTRNRQLESDRVY